VNKYRCTFNKSGEITVLETSANTHYQAISNCLSVMAKRYGVKKQSLIRYFQAEQLNHEVKII